MLHIVLIAEAQYTLSTELEELGFNWCKRMGWTRVLTFLHQRQIFTSNRNYSQGYHSISTAPKKILFITFSVARYMNRVKEENF